MSDSPNVSGPQGYGYVSSPQDVEKQYVTGKSTESRDSISKSSALPCYAVGAPTLPIPTLLDDPLSDVSLAQKKQALEKMIAAIVASEAGGASKSTSVGATQSSIDSSGVASSESETPSSVSQQQALMAFLTVSGALKQSAANLSITQLNLNLQQAGLSQQDLESAQTSLNTMQSLLNQTNQDQQEINILKQNIEQAQSSSESSQTNINDLNNEIEQAYTDVQNGQTSSASNPYVQILSQIKSMQISPAIALEPNNLSNLVQWFQIATDGSHSINGSAITPQSLSSVALIVNTYNTNEQTIEQSNTTIQTSQEQLDTLNEQISQNNLQQQAALSQVLNFLKLSNTNNELNTTPATAALVSKATTMASKIIENINNQSVNAQENQINALKAFITIEGQITVKQQQTQQDAANQAQATSRLNVQVADLQYTLSSEIANVASEIQANQSTVNNLQTQITNLGYAADALGGAIVAATVACVFSFGIGCAATAALSVALGSVMIAKGALQCQVGEIETNISNEQAQEASLQKQYSDVQAISQMLGNVSGQFVDLVSSVLQVIQQNTKSASTSIEAMIQAEKNLNTQKG